MKFFCRSSVNRPTNFYVGVTQQSSEPTLLVQHLLANLTGSTVNVTQENCQNQREDEEDKESKHVWFCSLCRDMIENEILLWSLMGLVYLNVCQVIVHDFFSFPSSSNGFIFLDVLLHVGPRCQASQQHTAGGFLCPLHGSSFQSAVPGLRAAGVHFQRLFDVDGVQVEEHQRTHILGSQSRPGGKP